MNLSLSLASVTRLDIQKAHAAQAAWKEGALNARYRLVAEKYPGFTGIMTVPCRPKIPSLTKGKIAGYCYACNLLSSVAERTDSRSLEKGLLDITEDEMFSVLEEILTTDKMAYAHWFASNASHYYGYVAGMWDVFMEFLDQKFDHECIGFLIIAGAVIKIAERKARG